MIEFRVQQKRLRPFILCIIMLLILWNDKSKNGYQKEKGNG